MIGTNNRLMRYHISAQILILFHLLHNFHSKNIQIFPKSIMKPRKGVKKMRKTWFKKGFTPINKDTKEENRELDNQNEFRYIRPTTSEVEIAKQDPLRPSCASQWEDSNRKPDSTMVLRPKSDGLLEVEKKNSGVGESGDANCYRLFHTRKLCDMFNEVFHEHQQTSPYCAGRLDFDYASEEQRMLCWREKVICDHCHYTSKRYNLYNEIETGQPGRKAATANVGLNVGLSLTPIGPSSVRKLCLSSNIPAPSRRGLQKCANKVCKTIEEINKGDMKERRKSLRTINLLRGKPETEIAVQSDGMFNNPLYSGIGKTPFQPATQCSYSVVENMTQKKQVIAMENVSKLCSKHGYHSVTDETPCDIKSEKCSATIPMEQSIGEEKEWAKACFLDLREDKLQIKYLTTDPDTCAYKAAEELHQAEVSSTQPEHQIDTRHLSQNHRKYIKSKSGLVDMMPGVTKSYRQKKLNRFATDLSLRCQSEFEYFHHQTGGNTEKLKKSISGCSDALMECYQGNHRLCKEHSTVCQGDNDNNWLVKSDYLPYYFKLKLNCGSDKLVLRDCIKYRLSPSIIEKTKLNSNSQKAESVNNAIRHCLPRNVTYSRNFSGRAHSAVFKCNNGPGESILRLCEATGCPIPSNSKVSAGLLTEQKVSENDKSRCRSAKRKLKRKIRRNNLFKLYEKNQEKISYKKAQLLIKRAQTRQANLKIKQDHSYIVNRIKMRNQLKKIN